MRIRIGAEADIDALEGLYNDVCDHVARTVDYCGWRKGLYPTRMEAAEGVAERSLFLAERDGKVAGSLILRSAQEPAYARAAWHEHLTDGEVFVIHTFCVSPTFIGKGVGERLLSFAAEYGKKQGIRAIRLDVYEKNAPAIRLYERCGYTYIDTVSLGLEDIGLDWYHLYELPLTTDIEGKTPFDV